MINFYDTSSIQSLVSQRQEKYYSVLYERKMALEALRSQATDSQPDRIRRAFGLGLIRAGARFSGACMREVPCLPHEV